MMQISARIKESRGAHILLLMVVHGRMVRTVFHNTTMIATTMAFQISTHMMKTEDIIMIGKMEKEDRHISKAGHQCWV